LVDCFDVLEGELRPFWELKERKVEL